MAKSFINSANSIFNFSYGSSVCHLGSLKYEYGSIKVKNFLMFYMINEENKIVTIVRVLYQKMDISNILDS